MMAKTRPDRKLPRKIAIVMAWLILLSGFVLGWKTRIAQSLLLLFFPLALVPYVIVLQVIEPWLARSERRSGDYPAND